MLIVEKKIVIKAWQICSFNAAGRGCSVIVSG